MKYYYHLVSDNTFKVGDKIEIGKSGNGMWKDVYASTIIKNNPKNELEKDEILSQYDFILGELAAEELRCEEFPNLPSRLKCLYLCDSKQAVEKRVKKFSKIYNAIGREVTQIIKVSVDNEPYACTQDFLLKTKSNFLEYKDLARKFFLGMKKGSKANFYMFVGTLTVEKVYKI